jgi:hypothetical protein
VAERDRSQDVVGVVSGVLLALATTASAWCAYQSSLWNGEQTRALAGANTAQFEALRDVSAATKDVIVDVTTFLDYVHDVARGDDKVAGYLRRHARAEFKPALERWIAATDSGRIEAPLPFTSSDYRVGAMKRAEALQARAAELTTTANDANETSDRFVLHTVLFAMALFFLGTSGQALNRIVRRATLGLGAVVLVVGLISMSRIPRASSPVRHHHAPASETSG